MATIKTNNGRNGLAIAKGAELSAMYLSEIEPGATLANEAAVVLTCKLEGGRKVRYFNLEIAKAALSSDATELAAWTVEYGWKRTGWLNVSAVEVRAAIAMLSR